MAKYNVLPARLVASVIDGLLLSIPSLLLYGIEILTKNKYNISSYFTFIYLWYFIKAHSKYGQTIGKKIAKIKVVAYSDESRTLTLKEAFMREIFFIGFCVLELSLIYFNYYSQKMQQAFSVFFQIYIVLDCLVVFFGNKRRSLHDFTGNSVVISIKEDEKDLE